MTTESYKTYWENCGERLYTYTKEVIARHNTDFATRSFLTSYGLPEDAAPFLTFHIKEGMLDTPGKVFKIDFVGSDNYLMFGSNGSGDPLCIDITNGNHIVYLNHDDNFNAVFINEDILKFACCLIRYRDFIASILTDDPNDFSRRKFTDIELEELKKSFIAIDSRCLAEEAFWSAQLSDLVWERDYE
ncbi:MAG: hypothetical protein EOO04_34755 [Chitinophagaceae bacterium]|nr:MAG: hypothetical protein EOO04_34755 [Chitinophagaceae bacterium]